MRRFMFVVVAALILAGGASADPVKSHQAAYLYATCTGLGSVTLVNTAPARTAALQVVGTGTIVLVPFNNQPGIIQGGTAAGTYCTFVDNPSGGPNTVPVLIIQG